MIVRVRLGPNRRAPPSQSIGRGRISREGALDLRESRERRDKKIAEEKKTPKFGIRNISFQWGIFNCFCRGKTNFFWWGGGYNPRSVDGKNSTESQKSSKKHVFLTSPQNVEKHTGAGRNIQKHVFGGLTKNIKH